MLPSRSGYRALPQTDVTEAVERADCLDVPGLAAANGHHGMLNGADAVHDSTTDTALSAAPTPTTDNRELRCLSVFSVALLLLPVVGFVLVYCSDQLTKVAPAPVAVSSPLSSPSFPLGAPLPAICLTEWRSRWGNKVYETMFVLSAAARHQLHPYVPAWELGFLGFPAQFHPTCPEARDDGSVVQVRVPVKKQWGDWFEQHPLTNVTGSTVVPSSAYNDTTSIPLHGVAVYEGWFQYHHSGYRPYKAVFAAHMKLEARRERALEQMWHRLLFALDESLLLVAVHIRHGDYKEDLSTCNYCRVPISWYAEWLRALRANHSNSVTFAAESVSHISTTSTLQRALQVQHEEKSRALQSAQTAAAHGLGTSDLPTARPCSQLSPLRSASDSSSISICLLVVSDDIASVAADFRALNESVLTSGDVLAFLPTGWRINDVVSAEVLDWWLLTRAALVGLSHSSFSYTASLFNSLSDKTVGGKHFWRPDPWQQALAAFEPWDEQYVDSAFKDARRQAAKADSHGS